MMRKTALLVALAALCVSQVASAALITNVDRTRGTAGNRAPIGVFDKDTDPLPMPVGGLMDGNLIYSDRTYTWVNTPAQLIGAEYVSTFNTDKATTNIMVNYAVTIGQPAILAIAVDDRIPDSYKTDGSVVVFESQQEAVDLIVHTWAAPGTFVDTGLNVYIGGDNDRPMSVYATTDFMPAGTYNFGLHPTNQNFYIIGAIPEPATIALLGLGGLGLLRKRRG
ncbi:MAG TPA: PEP-CTERM sorting domain-containing protein [Phycisphaerales bacterium]|nr:PEP-CTERM sorting domain-containing protein [Phycisphaerales bacterium]